MKAARYKELMEQVGMPNSQSLLLALEQVANEVGQEQHRAGMLAAADMVEHGRYKDGGYIGNDPRDAVAYQIRREANTTIPETD